MPYKNKGILVPVYVIVCFIGFALLVNVLKWNVGGIFAMEHSMLLPMGFAVIIAGIWTYLTSEVHVKVNGQRMKVDFESSFFFIPMKVCGWILVVIGLIVMIWGIYATIWSHTVQRVIGAAL